MTAPIVPATANLPIKHLANPYNETINNKLMHIPETYYDHIFHFLDKWETPSLFGLKMTTYQDKTIILVTELYQTNPGTSVTYNGYHLLQQIIKDKDLNEENG